MTKDENRKLRNDNFGKYFVLKQGSDCDGMSSAGLTAFEYESEANENAQEHSEWSDGLTYHVTTDLREVMNYCEEWDLEFIEKILIDPIYLD